MSKNKYGFFKYSDFSASAANGATFEIPDVTLQPFFNDNSGNLQAVFTGRAQDFLSFEPQGFDLNKHVRLLDPSAQQFTEGVVTAYRSGSNGLFVDGATNSPFKIEIELTGYYSMSGLTVKSRNVIKSLKIEAYQDNALVASGQLIGNDKEEFFPLVIEDANNITLTVEQVEPLSFVGVWGIQFGTAREFGDDSIISASVSKLYSLTAKSLEYDTLDLTVLDPQRGDYLVQNKQTIDFCVGDKNIERFFANQGVENGDNTTTIQAYNVVSVFEAQTLGGFTGGGASIVLENLLKPLGYNVSIDAWKEPDIDGYIPICTVREALQYIAIGSGLRFSNQDGLDTLRVEPVPTEPEETAVEYTEANIVGQPKYDKTDMVKTVTLKLHKLSQVEDTEELYHWYIAKNKKVKITFSSPHANLKAYEVTGHNADGDDLVAETPSKNVTFDKKEANYCVVVNKSNNKIVIVGNKYEDTTVEYTSSNAQLADNDEASEVNYETYICTDDPQAICDELLEQNNRRTKITFSTLDRPKIGKAYNILGKVMVITKVTDTLTGVYEVEAI
nr:MAG TPA: hypothetical protein [Caudoviricetes sp.]